MAESTELQAKGIFVEISPGRALRQTVEEGLVRLVGAPNALVARQIESFGFEAIYLSGAVLSAGVIGLPDVGLFSLTELEQQAKYLARSVNLPLVVDADTGFGDVLQVERTVAELEGAGAAAVQFEDQQLPKRCGHLSGKTLVEPDEMCAKITAAAEARHDEDFVIVARTDARGVNDLDDALRRAEAYVNAGADWIFPEALQTPGEFERFAKALDVPLMANMTEFGKSPLLSIEELDDLGYSVVLFPVTLFRVAMQATNTACAVLASQGTQRDLLEIMQTREELYELLGYEDFEERDRRFFSPDGDQG